MHARHELGKQQQQQRAGAAPRRAPTDGTIAQEATARAGKGKQNVEGEREEDERVGAYEIDGLLEHGVQVGRLVLHRSGLSSGLSSASRRSASGRRGPAAGGEGRLATVAHGTPRAQAAAAAHTPYIGGGAPAGEGRGRGGERISVGGRDLSQAQAVGTAGETGAGRQEE